LDHPAHEPDGGLDALVKIVAEAGLKVHKALGPGLVESVYEHCLAHELQARGVPVQRQPAADARPDHAYGRRLDLVVAEAILVEIGAVDAPARLHDPEILARLRQSGRRLGLRLDFDAQPFSAGVQRFVI
jgi:GxxExxY protein